MFYIKELCIYHVKYSYMLARFLKYILILKIPLMISSIDSFRMKQYSRI